MFSKKATKIDEIVTVDLTLCSEDFVDFCGLLRKHELYAYNSVLKESIFSLFYPRTCFSGKLFICIYVVIYL